MADKKTKPSTSVAKKGTIKRSAKSAKPPRPPLKPAKPGGPVLLSGGNPQIAKGYGDAPVAAYIAALPGWKQDVGRRLDELIVAAVPDVYKAVKWNTPFYGFEDKGWFVGFHCMTKYIKVSFFRGASLKPIPPVESKQEDVRYYHINEDGQIDEAQFSEWVKQASKLPLERI